MQSETLPLTLFGMLAFLGVSVSDDDGDVQGDSDGDGDVQGRGKEMSLSRFLGSYYKLPKSDMYAVY